MYSLRRSWRSESSGIGGAGTESGFEGVTPGPKEPGRHAFASSDSSRSVSSSQARSALLAALAMISMPLR